jgi:hypothetical protein
VRAAAARPSLPDASDEAILAADVPLTEVQFALARDYGFPSWPALRAAVASVRPPVGYAPDAQPGALVLPAPPTASDPAPDHLCGALAMALSVLEAPVDAVRLAGDSGRAFILQGPTRCTSRTARCQLGASTGDNEKFASPGRFSTRWRLPASSARTLPISFPNSIMVL